MKNVLTALLNLRWDEHRNLLKQIKREFGFLIKRHGYEINHCAYLNAMYWVMELWSPTELLGINISNEMGIAVFVMIPQVSNSAQRKIYLYLPVLVSYITNNPRFINMEKQGKIPLGRRALRWYAALLREHYPLIVSALNTEDDRIQISERVKKYTQEENKAFGLLNLGPINFKIDKRWKREGACWIRKQ